MSTQEEEGIKWNRDSGCWLGRIHPEGGERRTVARISGRGKKWKWTVKSLRGTTTKGWATTCRAAKIDTHTAFFGRAPPTKKTRAGP